jgi:hypothetical protein
MACTPVKDEIAPSLVTATHKEGTEADLCVRNPRELQTSDRLQDRGSLPRTDRGAVARVVQRSIAEPQLGLLGGCEEGRCDRRGSRVRSRQTVND